MSTRPPRQATEPGTESVPADHGHVQDRRRFFRTVALGGAAVAAGAGAVPLLGGAASAQTTTLDTLPPTIPAADVKLVNFATTLELAASQIYSSMATTGKIFGEPLSYMRQYVTHHSSHATALATLAADEAVSTPNKKLLSQILPQLATATATDIYRLAFQLESSMAATHQDLMGTLTNWQSAGTVATLEPVEAQHAVVWGQLLDLPVDQWIPPFQNTDGAYDPATYAAS
jgi:hypothetical protein